MISNQNERNDYVETIEPILYCFRITGILSAQFTIKTLNSRFLASKFISALTQTVYLVNLVYNLFTFWELVNIVGDNFSLKILVVLAPQIFLKVSVIIIPLDIWSKSRQLQNYWTKWKKFQDEFERISETVFDSNKKKTVRKIIFIANLIMAIGGIITQKSMSYGGDYTKIISDTFNTSIAYYLGAYWYINCMYVQSIAKEIISLGKKTLQQDNNGEKLREIISLWLTLCELLNEFYVIHCVLLLVYILETIIGMTVFAFICMNSSTFLDIYGLEMQLNGLIVCMFILFLICETAHFVYKEVVINQRKMLLLENSIRMDSTKLQSISLFLETIFVKNPGVCIKGYLTLNRAAFASILAVCINYLIVLRQFQ